MQENNLRALDKRVTHSDDSQNENPSTVVEQAKNRLLRLQSQAAASSANLFGDEMLHEPFYAWQCVTLHLEHKTLDFVITDEEALFTFINFMQTSLTVRLKAIRAPLFLGTTERSEA